MTSDFFTRVTRVFPKLCRVWRGAYAGLALCAAASASTYVNFNISPGDAEAVLRSFVKQSEVQVIFADATVEGRRLPGIHGRFLPREALEQIVARSPLRVWEDERTGALAVGLGPEFGSGTALQERPAIRLPPFVVEERVRSAWRYASAPGIEVLSQCPDEITSTLIFQHYALHALLERVLPKSLQAQTDLPVTYVFYDAAKQPTLAKELLIALERRHLALSGKTTDADASSISGLPNYRFWDQDSRAVFFVFDGEPPPPMMLTSGYVRFLLEERTPTLPTWFVVGTSDLYEGMLLNTETALAATTAFGADGFILPFGRLKPNQIRIPRAEWMSRNLSEKLRQASDAGARSDFEYLLVANNAEPLPLAELMAHSADFGDEKYRQRWRSTASLLVRMMLAESPTVRTVAPGGGVPRDSAIDLNVTTTSSAERLWKYVDALSRGTGGEELMTQTLGFDYRDGDVALREYLFGAVRSAVTLTGSRLPPREPVTPREATETEVARLKGKFNRLEIGYVREMYPVLSESYIKQARHTLYRSYESGERDPVLLAELGLFECDVGNDRAAAPLLEAAARARVIHPRVYYELARIRFAAVRKTQKDAALTHEQEAAVIEPLLASRRQRPPLAESYELLAEVLLRAETKATPEQFEMLGEGLRLFPVRGRLLLSVALLQSMHGSAAEARALVERGLQVTADATERARFLKLKQALQ